MTNTQEPQRLQQQIETLQQQLAHLGPMRPGCLSRQYKKPQLKQGAYYQLSYTHRMLHHNEYVPPDWVPQIERELAEYRRFRHLTQEWIALSIQLSRLKMKLGKETPAATRKSV
jgi:hypothetical protein